MKQCESASYNNIRTKKLATKPMIKSDERLLINRNNKVKGNEFGTCARCETV